MTEHKEHIRFCTSDFQNGIKQNIEIVLFSLNIIHKCVTKCLNMLIHVSVFAIPLRGQILAHKLAYPRHLLL
jgi:hypothetical protein